MAEMKLGRFDHPMIRFSGLAAVCGLLIGIGHGRLSAQEKGQTVEEKRLITRDNWPIYLTYYKSELGKEAPVVLLLHAKGGNRLIWTRKAGFAERLNQFGYAVIAIDLRKHGQSKLQAGNVAAGSSGKKKNKKKGPGPTDLNPTDYPRMVAYDLEAVKKFIYQEHQRQNLNMRKFAIVAPEMSAPIAINFAVRDWSKKPYPDAPTLNQRTPRGQDVRALVLLSPQANLPKLTTGKSLARLRLPAWGIAFLICVGTKDKLDKGDAAKMYQQLTGIAQNKKRMYLQKFNSRFRGTDMLGPRLNVAAHMLGFLDKHLKQLPDPWRDRRSRLSR